ASGKSRFRLRAAIGGHRAVGAQATAATAPCPPSPHPEIIFGKCSNYFPSHTFTFLTRTFAPLTAIHHRAFAAESAGLSPRSSLPSTRAAILSPVHPVRLIDAFVDGLKLEQCGFARTKPAESGRPPLSPGDLLKLYLWGYLNKVRSSRCLERECKRNPFDFAQGRLWN